MAFSFVAPQELDQLNITEEEYKAILCRGWEKWREAVFAGKNPQEAILSAQNFVKIALAEKAPKTPRNKKRV